MKIHVYRNRPDDHRTRDELHFCPTCRGWYGVPHDGQVHTRHHRRAAACACAPCRVANGLRPQGAYGFVTEAPEWQP